MIQLITFQHLISEEENAASSNAPLKPLEEGVQTESLKTDSLKTDNYSDKTESSQEKLTDKFTKLYQRVGHSYQQHIQKIQETAYLGPVALFILALLFVAVAYNAGNRDGDDSSGFFDKTKNCVLMICTFGIMYGLFFVIIDIGV